MKNFRKLVCSALVLAMLTLTVMPAYAESVNWNSKTVYLDGKDGQYGNFWINIQDIKKNTKITDVKSSRADIISINTLNRWSDTNYSFEEKKTTYTDYTANISCYGRKKGTATVSFKVDGKSYSNTYKVVDYVNPLKSLVISSIGSTNLKSRFSKQNSVSHKLRSNTKAGTVKATAASGWKIRQLEWSQQSGGWSYKSYYTENGTSSAKINIPAMKKNTRYLIWIVMINDKTKATKDINFWINDD